MRALRRYRLRALLKTRFSDDRGKLMEASRLSKGRISQLLDEDGVFGDNAARNLEERLQLDPGYFDTLDARTLRFAMAFEALPIAAKGNWEELVKLLGDNSPKSPPT